MDDLRVRKEEIRLVDDWRIVARVGLAVRGVDVNDPVRTGGVLGLADADRWSCSSGLPLTLVLILVEALAELARLILARSLQSSSS